MQKTFGVGIDDHNIQEFNNQLLEILNPKPLKRLYLRLSQLIKANFYPCKTIYMTQAWQFEIIEATIVNVHYYKNCKENKTQCLYLSLLSCIFFTII